MKHSASSIARVLISICAVSAHSTTLAGDVKDQYEECWRQAALGKLNETPYENEAQAEAAVDASIDEADWRCVKLARQVWRLHGEAAWTEQHGSMILQLSNANLQLTLPPLSPHS